MTRLDAIAPHPSLSDQAFGAIANAITQGTIKPGSRIKEATIARDLGISRGPLREAIRKLESQGLVERRQNLGAYVIQLSLEDLDDLFQMREVLEGRAAGLAAIRIDDASLEQLTEMLARHRSQTVAMGRYPHLTTDDDFHFTIIRHSGSRRLFNTICSELYLQIRLYRIRSASRAGRAEMALNEHRDIVEALASRSSARAEEAMRAHIASARKNLMWSAEDVTTIEKDEVDECPPDGSFAAGAACRSTAAARWASSTIPALASTAPIPMAASAIRCPPGMTGTSMKSSTPR